MSYTIWVELLDPISPQQQYGFGNNFADTQQHSLQNLRAI